jgi:hypothetical protein
MYYGFTSSATTGNFGTIVFAPPPPRCACGMPSAFQHPQTGERYCDRCAHVLDAPIFLEKIFRACAPEQRGKLYRQLSIVFHPDTGGDERLMRALNAVKEQFP